MRLLFFFAALLLSSCSGGGSSESDSPVPPASGSEPPSTANTAPDLRLTLSSSQVFERQTISIDASTTTDTDDDPLTYALELGETPFAAIGSSTEGPVWTLDTTEIDEDTIVEATVSVSDGFETVTKTMEFTIANYNRTPLNATWEYVSDTYEVSANGSAKFSENRYYEGFKGAHLLRTNNADQLEAVEFSCFNSTFGQPVEIAIGMPGDEAASLITKNIQFQSEYRVSPSSRPALKL